MILEFGQFRLDLIKRELRRDDELVSLTPKVFDTLRVLAQNHGEIVTKETLMNEIWADSFVEESGLMRNISVLRKALGEQRSSAPFIVTVPGHGYRFIAETRSVSSEIGRESLVSVMAQSDVAYQSLAVLPFRTLGSPNENQYLGLGMADALITRLTNLEKLRVRPTSAVIKYDGAHQKPFEAGTELGVPTVIEGTIWKVGEQLRITVQMVSVESQTTLWAGKFDESFNDIFAIQDSISEQVADALKVQLTVGDRARLTKHETDNLNAYELYLQGLYHLNNMSAESTMQAMAFLEKAIAADPNYALAYTSLCGCLILIGLFSVMPSAAFADKARGLAAKALEIDPTLPASHYTSGFSAMLFDWDFAAAEKSLLRAIALNPRDAQTHRYYSLHLLLTGRGEEAVITTEKAIELDPVTPILKLQLGHTLYFSRRYDEAIAAYRTFLETNPKFLLAQKGLARSYAAKGMLREARTVIDGIEPVFRDYPRLVSARAFLAAQSGNVGECRKELNRLHSMSTTRYVSPYDFALVHAGLNESDEVFAWLEKAVDEKSTLAAFLKVDPYFDNIRNDSRFDLILERIGF